MNTEQTSKNIFTYDNANFINSLTDVLNEHENQEHLLNDPDCFYKVCAEVLNRHAPQKEKLYLKQLCKGLS